ncbi:hypothetical protein ACMSX5_001676 [Cronobacter turicensis]|uniref:DUF4238 domain-containing protein n=2 Tax=Cronobacter turicensis TaxID=413502 RepID=C9XWG3_CROTZ|nr:MULTISPECIES: hypothetical protein [Cronobacter]ELQ6126776.1 hypothetical protein [Cronobacter dublinensis]EMD9175798.1 hypothetical protein [Cronobacter turicensis]MDK1237967.1 hypothetical protein [Cronobacter turicensis]CBA28296.1 hypothetical protein CTU_08580 [Cronobacter turicensis z3032]
MKGICKLCLEEKDLMESHSIPRSYFKRLKKSDSQLIIFQKGSKPKRENVDPKEPLLCFECEQFISNEYESYGTRLLRNHHNIRKNSDHIIINSFDYKRFYLFLLSILWRASISKSVHYSTVNGVPELDDLMRHCIKNKQVRINKLSHLKVDNFIRICVFRLIDTTNKIPDCVIKAILSNFAFRKMDELDGVAWYFIVEGFAIFFIFSAGKDYHDVMRMRLKSQLTSGSHQKIFKIDIFQSPFFAKIFIDLLNAANENK